jgi:phytoene dehydrogenase-like protein
VSKALERNYDGIIIGAGHHGLVLGSYLARAGLKILLVERRLDYGGGLCTKEATKPGFYHNLHSINHFHISETPWFHDLGLGDRVEYITPPYEFGQPHKDGTALVFGRHLDETLANVARFSKKDAQTFKDWNRKAEEITSRILIRERYADPLPKAEREAQEKLAAEAAAVKAAAEAAAKAEREALLARSADGAPTAVFPGADGTLYAYQARLLAGEPPGRG